jgi:plastocyanin
MTALVYDGFSLPVVHDHSGGGAGLGPPPTANVPASPTAPAAVATAPAPSVGDLVVTTNAIAVRAVDNRFDPLAAAVPVGATVTWTNNGTNLHNVTSFDGLFDSGPMASGSSFKYTFSKAGTFRLYCRQHFLTGMFGTITVR